MLRLPAAHASYGCQYAVYEYSIVKQRRVARAAAAVVCIVHCAVAAAIAHRDSVNTAGM
jgi:hypothetical protein